jgi:threonine dehydrogenase-like Zn-dependent dehydrogenase
VLVLEAPGRLAFVEHELAAVEDGGFRTETLFSGLSAGTELTYFKGTNPYLHAGWDSEYGVFVEGRPATSYPVERLGYMEVARVVESRTAGAREGSLVAMAYGHRSGFVAGRQERFVPLPDDVDPVLGVYVAHMGPICANGLLHAGAELVGRDVRDLGDGVRGLNVLVTGAGVVGLLTALFAQQAGAAEVAVCDRSPRRLAAADGLGLLALDESEAEPWQVVKERWLHGPGDRGADVVFQCRGQVASLAVGLRALRPQGTVVDLAFYQGGADDLRLGEEFHHNGLAIRCAQIGRVPRGLAHLWSRRRLAAETLELLRMRGADIREHLVTDVVPFDAAPRLFAEIAGRVREPLQTVFDLTPQAATGEAPRERTMASS